MSSKKSFKIVLVGPTNVGKSTLFNRLTHTRKAIVCDRPGVTVDRHELSFEREDVNLTIIDTGGVGPTAMQHPLGAEIERAAAEAVSVANLIFFVVDGTRELDNEERNIAAWLRKQPKQIDTDDIYVLANKVDTNSFDLSSYYKLGFADVLPVSAEHGTGLSGVWDLVDTRTEGLAAFAGAEAESREEELGEVYGDDNFVDDGETELSADALENDEFSLPRANENLPVATDAPPRVIVIGRPNVGKSTLINTLIRQQRHVVSDMPGTTRDVIASDFESGGMRWTLLDSAGMRRPGRLERGVEWVATQKLREEAKKSDLALVVVDSSEGITDLDASIAGLASDLGLGVVLVFNKWDKMEGASAEDRLFNFERTKMLKFRFLEWAPSVQISGLSGKGVPNLIKTLKRVYESRSTRVTTAKLNSLFEHRIKHHSHPVGPNSKPAKFYYISQVSASPPEFVLFSNIPGPHVHFSYKRFLVNALRAEFGFEGTPIKIHFKQAR
ncbi:MAG TPA: ribosome biogenesis GTPase Der [Bdellovibrionota bacterium]|jgi:GTP-binding protein|nr:ribosome biogenesis GTPase Der [Bdellovibrionota bacterium]